LLFFLKSLKNRYVYCKVKYLFENKLNKKKQTMPYVIDTIKAGSIDVTQSITINGQPISGGGTSSKSKYRFAQFPETTITSTQYDPTIAGKYVDISGRGNDYPLLILNNGNIATIEYNQSVLPYGIFIFECYDTETIEDINGYWVAFKQNANDPELLEKVGEVQMTQQFWDNWYDWTVKDSGDNTVKFVYVPWVMSFQN
jgi:hypothetical protein